MVSMLETLTDKNKCSERHLAPQNAVSKNKSFERHLAPQNAVSVTYIHCVKESDDHAMAKHVDDIAQDNSQGYLRQVKALLHSISLYLMTSSDGISCALGQALFFKT